MNNESDPKTRETTKVKSTINLKLRFKFYLNRI